MLKVCDDGVIIRLDGRADNRLFWWSLSLVLVGIVVAIACMALPVAYAIGSLFVFAVLMFGFNIQKHRAKSQHCFTQGELILTPKRFSINQIALTLADDAKIEQVGNWLIVKDRGLEYRFSGFADERQMQVARSVLAGATVQANQVAIRINQ
ncbi:hypothetical protein [Moraxella cuniculi]|uniref:Uncharacterized protein n=1 Tax=Moraxella cuniculi TaxID=34061 RepID=A0A448GW99_9GAMM|nr:hypothetical protein [Moraxella cuniculi]VEG13035.1 Uncharacterised protein [Moraxella cuniculi]